MNWKNIINDLKLCKISDQDIAGEIGCNQSTITRLKNGKIEDPSWSQGDRLLKFHKSKSRLIKKHKIK